MKHLLRDLELILALAILWAIGGYTFGKAIEIIVETLNGDAYQIGIILASVNVIIGMLLFKGITRDPTAERIFFNGPNNEGEGDIRVGCLWFLPATLLLYGLLMGLVALLFRFFLTK
jgi:hypothetical protein